jgi:hypothetical protein
MPAISPRRICLVVTSAWLLAACGGGPTSSAYAPKIDPASFTDRISNRYFPLKEGTSVYDGTKDGAPMHIEMAVLPDRKTILGVSTMVVHDTVSISGKLQEDTFDWYAQDARGSVWYFGEDTRELDPDGRVVSTQGTWLAGVNGAQPGIVMPANPTVGTTYQQEYARGVAEDRIKVLRMDASLQVPAGTYQNLIQTEDTTPLEPNKLEHKWFAPGVGFLAGEMLRGGSERIQYVRFVS